MDRTDDGRPIKVLTLIDEYTKEALVIALLRDGLLNGEIFYTLREAQVLIEQWRQRYNRVRPHSALGHRPPAPEARGPPLAPWKTGQHRRAA